MSDFLTKKTADIARAMKPREFHEKPRDGHYDIEPYQTTHNTGGAIMGSNPQDSVVNRYLQHWDVSNLFVMGVCAFSAEPRVQSDRNGRSADLLGSRRDQEQVSEESRSVGAGVRSESRDGAHLAIRLLLLAAVALALPEPALGPSNFPWAAERGRYLGAAGDCQACHTNEGGKPFAGGRPIQTPFGIDLFAQHHAGP